MLSLIASEIKKISELLTQESLGLNDEDMKTLSDKGPKLVRQVSDNAKSDKKKVLNGLSDEDKRALLAYVVYKRENITTTSVDNPNDEDAARILHKDVYKTNEKESQSKVMKRLERDLIKQLKKAGLPIDEKE